MVSVAFCCLVGVKHKIDYSEYHGNINIEELSGLIHEFTKIVSDLHLFMKHI